MLGARARAVGGASAALVLTLLCWPSVAFLSYLPPPLQSGLVRTWVANGGGSSSTNSNSASTPLTTGATPAASTTPVNGSAVVRKKTQLGPDAIRVSPTVNVTSPAAVVGVNRAAKRTTAVKQTSAQGLGVKLPRKSAALVVHKGMTDRQTANLLHEVLERLNRTEKELKTVKRKMEESGLEVPTSRQLLRARKFVIDRRATMFGAAFAGSFAGLILGWSIFVNLWLVGAVAGAATCALLVNTDGPVGSFVTDVGIQVALVYKDVKDFYDQTVFLYKTGKLSYQYWSLWEEYDRRYGLTEKYSGALARVSREAYALDRQYRIRAKALGLWGDTRRSVRSVGSIAAGTTINLLRHATGFGTNVLSELERNRQQQQQPPPAQGPWWAPNMGGGSRTSRNNSGYNSGGFQWPWSSGGDGRGQSNGRGGLTSPWRFSSFSAPPKGKSYDDARRRAEQARKKKVGFMGQREPDRPPPGPLWW